MQRTFPAGAKRNPPDLRPVIGALHFRHGAGALHFAMAPLATVDVGFTGIPTFAGFLWVALVSVLLARRREPTPSG